MINLNVNQRNRIFSLAVLLLSLFSNIVLAEIKPAKKPVSSNCIGLGNWVIPSSGQTTQQDVILRAAKASVVLLGETHVNADHHRWQLQSLIALHTLHPKMIIGFEMFPRRVQAVLDQWIAGELSEKEFLRVVEWDRVWGTDANLYLPLFHFARMNRIPILALNIDPRLRHQVAEKGFYGVPLEEREGLTRPAEPSQAYIDFLLPIYKQHDRKDKNQGEISHDDPDFRRFIIGQQLWDRAMAQILRQAVTESKDTEKSLVVGVMGTGHILHGFGVTHQLYDLGIKDVFTLLPWDSSKSCKHLVKGIANAVFGTLPHTVESMQPQFQRLGIRYEIVQGGALVLQVEKNSIAESAQLQDADVILEMAGIPIKNTEDVITIVKRQAPGTWLPLKIKRADHEIQTIAKFPVLNN